MGLFDKLKQGLKKTKDLLRTDVRDLFTAGEILDEDKLEGFFRGMIDTDMGVAAGYRGRRPGRRLALERGSLVPGLPARRDACVSSSPAGRPASGLDSLLPDARMVHRRRRVVVGRAARRTRRVLDG